MSLKSNNKPPLSPQELQAQLNESFIIEKWVRMIESEEFTIATEYVLQKFKEAHILYHHLPHLHAHNTSSVIAAINFKQMLIDLAYELKYKDDIIKESSSDFIPEE